MLSTVIAATGVNGREVIVAIVGGTLLTLSLTRPRLAWMEQLTKHSESARLNAERALTGFLLVMGGYAATTLLVALHKQLGTQSDALLKVAGGFLFVYAWLVHFQPFMHEWKLRGGFSAALFYTGFVCSAVIVGGLLTELALNGLNWADPWLALAAALTVAGFWVLYRFVPNDHNPHKGATGKGE